MPVVNGVNGLGWCTFCQGFAFAPFITRFQVQSPVYFKSYYPNAKPQGLFTSKETCVVNLMHVALKI